MDYRDIIYTKEAGIATITMNRPDTRNALSPAMTESIYKAVADTVKDDKVRVLILTGTDRAFCSGADVKAMGQGANQPGSKKRKTDKEMSQLPLLLQRCDKPIIAAINGVAAGGGFDLAEACRGERHGVLVPKEILAGDKLRLAQGPRNRERGRKRPHEDRRAGTGKSARECGCIRRPRQ